MQQYIDKLIKNSVSNFEELKIKIIENPTFTVDSENGEINFLLIDYKGLNDIKRLYLYSNNQLKPCRVNQFIRKIKSGEYKIVYEVA